MPRTYVFEILNLADVQLRESPEYNIYVKQVTFQNNSHKLSSEYEMLENNHLGKKKQFVFYFHEGDHLDAQYVSLILSLWFVVLGYKHEEKSKLCDMIPERVYVFPWGAQPMSKW